jgi:hypothetical protein
MHPAVSPPHEPCLGFKGVLQVRVYPDHVQVPVCQMVQLSGAKGCSCQLPRDAVVNCQGMQLCRPSLPQRWHCCEPQSRGVFSGLSGLSATAQLSVTPIL